MGYEFHEGPHTDFHDLNLEWVISEMRKAVSAWQESETYWTTAQDAFNELEIQYKETIINVENQLNENTEYIKRYIENWFSNINGEEQIEKYTLDYLKSQEGEEVISKYIAEITNSLQQQINKLNLFATTTSLLFYNPNINTNSVIELTDYERGIIGLNITSIFMKKTLDTDTYGIIATAGYPATSTYRSILSFHTNRIETIVFLYNTQIITDVQKLFLTSYFGQVPLTLNTALKLRGSTGEENSNWGISGESTQEISILNIAIYDGTPNTSFPTEEPLIGITFSTKILTGSFTDVEYGICIQSPINTNPSIGQPSYFYNNQRHRLQVKSISGVQYCRFYVGKTSIENNETKNFLIYIPI